MSSEVAAPAGGRTGFFTSVPGVLTAVAGLITAVGGAYAVVQQQDGDSERTTPVNLTIAAAPVPQEPVAVDVQGVDTAQLPDELSDDPALQMLDACGQGDEASCVAVLESLTQECLDGSGVSCDVLYLVSPVGSDYEAYGATCGGRFGADFAGLCSEQ